MSNSSIRLELIRIDGGTQPREELNHDVIRDYAQDMMLGVAFPPVTLFYDGSEYWLADGFHRYHAAKQICKESLDADVRQGTRRDAVLFSVGANASHGIRRTNADKRRAVETLLRDEEWVKWSDNQIAKQCGVNQSTVSRIRQENLSYALHKIDDSPRLVERNGTTYTMNTSRIGSPSSPEILHAPSHVVTEDPPLTREEWIARWQRDNIALGLDEWANIPKQEDEEQEQEEEDHYIRIAALESELEQLRGEAFVLGAQHATLPTEHQEHRKEPERYRGLFSERAYCHKCDEWHRDWEYPYGMKEGMWKCEECGTEIHSSKISIEGPTEKERYETACDAGTLDYYYEDLRREAFRRDEEEREAKNKRDAHVMQVMGSSESPEWYTPPEIIEKVLELMGTIDLDPCSNSHDNPKVPANNLYTKEDDGLSKQWLGKVYLNPPYGSEVGVWTNRLISEYKQDNVEEAIALLPGRIDTKWFAPLYEFLICIVRGRVQFENSPHHAPFPCVLVYLGARRDDFIKVFSSLGPIVERIS